MWVQYSLTWSYRCSVQLNCKHEQPELSCKTPDEMQRAAKFCDFLICVDFHRGKKKRDWLIGCLSLASQTYSAMSLQYRAQPSSFYYPFAILQAWIGRQIHKINYNPVWLLSLNDCHYNQPSIIEPGVTTKIYDATKLGMSFNFIFLDIIGSTMLRCFLFLPFSRSGDLFIKLPSRWHSSKMLLEQLPSLGPTTMKLMQCGGHGKYNRKALSKGRVVFYEQVAEIAKGKCLSSTFITLLPLLHGQRG